MSETKPQRAPELAELYQFRTGTGKLVQPASEVNMQKASKLLASCLEDRPPDLQDHPLYSWPVVSMVWPAA